ncbi:LuxR family two component transcriptional regulator [Tumebacillus permanentifrigoris]|uniref:LuxR family two component transcriptional regulator n=2 Tax=Tumebacillus permanentifrigoris TaxID=378543 RepID=A0A316D6I0_9BACL|nr:response regulator transcription factor [Tumebacillus permanentifrigoris]PWK08441.1 LuxR family two component transcriptional regulator [Tumebacillus permanentifrigoris]
MMEKIRVVLVDDQKMIRQGFGYVINVQPDMQVVGEAENGEEAVRVVLEQRPDVVLMDVQMPKKTGIEATREIVAELPQTKVVILTTFDVHEYVFEGIRAGAVGYLLKDSDAQEMLDVVRAANRGEAIYRTATAAQALGQMLAAQPAQSAPAEPSAGSPTVNPHRLATTDFQLLEPLTERERDVLQQMAYGLRNDAIAQKLSISEGTVKTHVHRILQKFAVEDRTQAVVQALRNGIVQ